MHMLICRIWIAIKQSYLKMVSTLYHNYKIIIKLYIYEQNKKTRVKERKYNLKRGKL